MEQDICKFARANYPAHRNPHGKGSRFHKRALTVKCFHPELKGDNIITVFHKRGKEKALKGCPLKRKFC